MSFLDRSIRQPDPARATSETTTIPTAARSRVPQPSTTVEQAVPVDPVVGDPGETAHRMQIVPPTSESKLLKTKDVVAPPVVPGGGIDYNEVLHDLLERRAELEAAMRAIQRIIGR